MSSQVRKLNSFFPFLLYYHPWQAIERKHTSTSHLWKARTLNFAKKLWFLNVLITGFVLQCPELMSFLSVIPLCRDKRDRVGTKGTESGVSKYF